MKVLSNEMFWRNKLTLELIVSPLSNELNKNDNHPNNATTNATLEMHHVVYGAPNLKSSRMHRPKRKPTNNPMDEGNNNIHI